MGRPRKEPAGPSSPQPATSKAPPAAPPPSATGSRAARSAPTAGRGREAKGGGDGPRPAASSRGARGDGGERRAAAAGSQKKAAGTKAAPSPAEGSAGPRLPGGTKAAPAQDSAKADARADAKADAKAKAGPSGASPHCPPALQSPNIPWVEEQTRGQRTNPQWYAWRENRITASLAPRIARSRFANGKTDEVPQSYLKAVLSTGPSVQTPAMSWGIRNEKEAVRAYERLKSQEMGRPVRVDECGLFIHKEKTWIAASPDGIVTEADTGKRLGLLEVKCPYKHRNRTVREACKDKDFCLELNGDSYALKRDHAYFTQMQCQLAATGLQHADFVVHTNKETAMAPVEFDAKFWGETVPKLEKFYTEAVIPHLEQQAGSSVWAKEE